MFLGYIWNYFPWSRQSRRAREDKRRNKYHHEFFIERILKPASAAPICLDALVSIPANSNPFFGRLPPEIRRCILMYAFGGHTLHMELGFQALPQRVDNEPTDPTQTAHAGIESQKLIPFGDRTGQWRWTGCICHRSPPEKEPLSLGRLRSDPMVRVRGSHYTDGCLVGKTACPHWPGEWPVKCQIGVMGWLLSCRQAYLEGLEVLYGTNTIQVSCHLLLRGFPELLSSTVHSHITSLALVWNPLDFPIRDVFVGIDLENKQLRENALFPSLAHLHIWLSSLENEVVGPAQANQIQLRSQEDLARNIPLCLDSMIIRLAPITTTVTVTCRSSGWFKSVASNHFKTQGKEWTQERESEYEGPEFWRQMPIGGIPSTLEQWEATKKNGRGYWIHLGPSENIYW